ncbi:helix-turn-helix transcriptional regulator [Ruminococcus sp.]|uniref:helix-turn-helix domain-containing protein n=1 Tax=Ruminococcus sp. TaxID=41978 RepID=UPI0025E99752|nr:helix-turn-helix transcriptional regulator [Ruminococcus sp.]MCR4640141.1 helix-turn-helix transcriptional regulator [Ruminococcus sp.]
MANKPQVSLKFIKGYGNNFKKLREDKQLTQIQLSKLIFVSDKSISLIEKEQREPTIEQINIYSEYFKASLDYLTGRTTIVNPTSQIISNFTGLSDDSILQIERTKNDSETSIKILNEIICNENFEYIIFLLKELYQLHKNALDLNSPEYIDSAKECEAFQKEHEEFFKKYPCSFRFQSIFTEEINITNQIDYNAKELIKKLIQLVYDDKS